MKAGKLLLPGVCCSILLLTACFQGEQSSIEIDPPENAEAVSDAQENESTEGSVEEEAENAEVEESETVARQLYLIDANGMVASQILELPSLESKEVATQVIEYLVEDGPVANLLPNGFRAVIPAGTEILGMDLQEDGTMIVDLSEEFKEYAADDELKIIESITHTLTQFESVESVQLWINGHPLDEMPVNGTPIGKGYSKENGINIVNTDTIDFLDSQAVTMFYPVTNQENRYYVPVTQYVESLEDNNVYGSIIQSLIEGPGFHTNVVHVFNGEAELVTEPTLNDGVLELVFNEAILQSTEESVIADEVMETIVRTLTSIEPIEAVNVKVENKEQLNNENGETYTEPVTSDFFTPSEKL
ncbi:GerMN domain-containing protein [Oceanobacillus sp. FSL H7-0719]|uniref:GerMN domain-containing protein n=1 Tax=Oceanobacillus sp. FSL H7-0719 TaxID=2954507 RepID=UPI0032486F38